MSHAHVSLSVLHLGILFVAICVIIAAINVFFAGGKRWVYLTALISVIIGAGLVVTADVLKIFFNL